MSSKNLFQIYIPFLKPQRSHPYFWSVILGRILRRWFRRYPNRAALQGTRNKPLSICNDFCTYLLHTEVAKCQVGTKLFWHKPLFGCRPSKPTMTNLLNLLSSVFLRVLLLVLSKHCLPFEGLFCELCHSQSDPFFHRHPWQLDQGVYRSSERASRFFHHSISITIICRHRNQFSVTILQKYQISALQTFPQIGLCFYFEASIITGPSCTTQDFSDSDSENLNLSNLILPNTLRSVDTWGDCMIFETLLTLARTEKKYQNWRAVRAQLRNNQKFHPIHLGKMCYNRMIITSLKSYTDCLIKKLSHSCLFSKGFFSIFFLSKWQRMPKYL